MSKENSVLIHNPIDKAHAVSYYKATANPAAGASAALSIPIISLSQLRLLSFVLTTDANAADRLVSLSFEFGAFVIPLGSADFAHTASTALQYICHNHAVPNKAAPVDVVMIPLPEIRLFPSTGVINILVTAIEAGDQLTAIYSWWDMWRGHTI